MASTLLRLWKRQIPGSLSDLSGNWSSVVERNDVVAGVKLGTFGREEGSMAQA